MLKTSETLELRPQRPEDTPAVRAFNHRLHSSGQPIPFFLPESGNASEAHSRAHWLMLEGDIVRGGVLLTFHRAMVAGKNEQVVNLQAPLTEGIVDRRYASLSVWLFRELERRFSLLYAVGMGGLAAPLPRLLGSLRWQVGLSAFRFAPIRPGRVIASVPAIRERIAPFLRPATGLAGRLAGPVYRSWLQFRCSGPLNVGAPGSESSSLVEAAWAHTAHKISFGVLREGPAAEQWFSQEQGESVLSLPGDPTACAVVRTRLLNDSRHFPGLRVATLLELMAPDDHRLSRLSRCVLAHLSRSNVDIAITNMTNSRTVSVLEQTGWLTAPSNYAVALSRAYAEMGVTLADCHVTRTDGDGRLNL